jgi:hypothetical protein
MVPGWTYVDVRRPASVGQVWDEGGYPALVWEPFVTLRPNAVAPVWTAGGAFNGIAIAKSGTGATRFRWSPLPMAISSTSPRISTPTSPTTTRPRPRSTSPIRCGRSTSATLNGDRSGATRDLATRIKYWWAYEMTFGILQRAVERHGDPTIVVSYPMGSSNVSGKEVPTSRSPSRSPSARGRGRYSPSPPRSGARTWPPPTRR